MPTIPAKPVSLRVRIWRRLQVIGLAGLRAESALAEVARSLPRDPSGPEAVRLDVVPRPSGATRVTRTGVHVDRIASAWLIRRFIDPQARLELVPAKGYVPEAGELRFDMFDAGFRC